MKASLKPMARVMVIALLCISTSALAQQTWTVNFKDTDIQEVIKFIADATGKTIVVDPKVRGQVRVISDQPVNEEELYQLFLSVMDVQGFTAVESGNVVRIVPNRDARSLPVPTTFGDQAPDDTYVTQVLMLENISASKVLPTLRPLVPQHGHLSAYDPSNAIIVTDTRANIMRLKEVIAQIDRSSVSETELVELRYARAEDVAQVVTQLERSGDREGGKAVMVVPDNRINGILVQGDQLQRQRIRELIRRLDRPQARDSSVRVVYLEYAKADRVAQVLTGVLQNLSRRGNNAEDASVQADEDTNALLITTSDDDIMQSLLTVIEGLDIRRAQVLVEAIIVEIEGSDGRELGVQWMYRDNKRGFGSSADGSGRMGAVGRGALDDSDDGLLSLAGTLSQTSGQMFGIGRLGERTDFLSILNMLQETSSTNILSTPNLLTTDNHTASISVGQNVPFATGSYASTGGAATPQNPFRTIERRDVGILLEVTPHINEGDSIVLNISQEVSSLSNIDSADGPITNQRKLQTQVLTADGETVVLGGMIQDDVQTSQQKVPFLGDIPILGHLFRNQTNRTSKTNLLIFIRATVVRDERTLEGATAEKYRAIRDEQMRHRGRSGLLINRSTIPVLPEWEEQMRGYGVERTDPDAMPEDEE
ncbi:type II secretion system secretin GspD [Marinimicrobium sp. ABcell2]|uniref:type II secretion system secretin GspD n=1 Tax=Marinimicrobium sp. ABcell2 TaxID=3069751 RepID=UPI0027B54C20|nr:type II secretion system secretin GspD [Marinimicrobium sp. ABcell2]MDQ2076663.1 type II secretion system secretin GspD [Marinimicrobium sp. ABcell2]